MIYYLIHKSMKFLRNFTAIGKHRHYWMSFVRFLMVLQSNFVTEEGP